MHLLQIFPKRKRSQLSNRQNFQTPTSKIKYELFEGYKQVLFANSTDRLWVHIAGKILLYHSKIRHCITSCSVYCNLGQ